jgi:hypothetical protein
VTGTSPRVEVHENLELLAGAAAARLISVITRAQRARGAASAVLTGGRGGNALLAALAAASDRDTIDWSALDLWGGDERFLPAGDPERNHTQAAAALLDAVPLDPARVRPMPAADGRHGTDADAAARAAAAPPGPAAPPPAAGAPPAGPRARGPPVVGRRGGSRRPGATLRCPAAGRGSRHPCGLVVPRSARDRGDRPHGGGRVRRSQTSADAPHPHPAGDPRRP